MFIGQSKCGKTTLAQAVQGLDIKYRKTQAVCFSGSIVDTPGEFIENRRFYSALITSCSRCDILGFVQDSTSANNIFPPHFASMFNKEVIGIISKCKLQDSNIERSTGFLRLAGVTNIIETSTIEDVGIQELISLLS